MKERSLKLPKRRKDKNRIRDNSKKQQSKNGLEYKDSKLKEQRSKGNKRKKNKSKDRSNNMNKEKNKESRMNKRKEKISS